MSVSVTAQQKAQEHWNFGNACYTQGDLRRAERAYRDALEQWPQFAEASANLGLIYLDQGRYAEAEALFRTVVAAQPEAHIAYYNLSNALLAQHRLEAAEQALLRVIELQPALPEAHNALGNLRMIRCDYTLAQHAFQQAIALNSRFPAPYNNLANCLSRESRYKEAENLLKIAITLNPTYAEAHSNLGSLWTQQKRYSDAERHLQQAVQIAPRFAGAWNNLGILYQALQRLPEAENAYRCAVSLAPNDFEFNNNLGGLMLAIGDNLAAEAPLRTAVALQPDKADTCARLGLALVRSERVVEGEVLLRQALQQHPDAAMVHYLYGSALAFQGNHVEAEAHYRRALELGQDEPGYHLALGMALLHRAEFAMGWKEYEWRGDPTARSGLISSRWQGEPFHGRSLLVLAEQGLGDMIQFVRYLPKLKEAGAGRVVVQCYPELYTLFAGIEGVDARILVSQTAESVACDLHVPMLSLPGLFRTDLKTIPARIPYLRPSAQKTDFWYERLAPQNGLKIGIVWAGSTDFKHDRHRSCRLEQFVPLFTCPGTVWYSLQKGTPQAQIAQIPAASSLVDLSGELHDFEDTAAVILNLDLVITVDTSVAHLAGACGRPVWTLLPFSADWRWMDARPDSPWYPTMRLFRQQELNNWSSVVVDIADALMAFSPTVPEIAHP